MEFETPGNGHDENTGLSAEVSAALERAAIDIVRLISVNDEELEATDVPDLARDVYALSYRHLKAFLGRFPLTFKEHEAQAKLALGFVANAERTRLQVLQLGRQRGDATVEAQLVQLRKETLSIAEHKAKVLYEREAETRATAPSSSSG